MKVADSTTTRGSPRAEDSRRSLQTSHGSSPNKHHPAEIPIYPRSLHAWEVPIRPRPVPPNVDPPASVPLCPTNKSILSARPRRPPAGKLPPRLAFPSWPTSSNAAANGPVYITEHHLPPHIPL